MSGEEQRERYISNTTTVTELCTDVSVTCLWNSICTIYLPIAVASSPGPQPPTGVSVDTLSHESVDVSWDAQQSMQCDVVIGNYSVRYQRRNAITAGYTSYTTVYTSETQNTLLELEPGTNYRVSVASIASNGEMSAYSDWVNFANVMAAPSQCERESLLQQHACM